MTLLYCPPCFLDHETGNHPERADRIRQIPERLEAGGPAGAMPPAGVQARRPAAARPRPFARLYRRGLGLRQIGRRIHRSRHGRQPRQLRRGPDGRRQRLRRRRADRPRRRHPGPVPGPPARPPCHGQPRDGLLPVQQHRGGRPAGHRRARADRVLIVDWDIHHGNGTQAAFWEDPQVGFLSIHRWPFYPGTGDADETGGGRGLGTTLNLPIEFGTPRKNYLAIFARQPRKVCRQDQAAIGPAQRRFRRPPARSGRRSRPGDRGLRSVDRLVLDVADAYAGGQLVSVLEGGYDPTLLADCVELHLAEMLKRNSARMS